MKLWTSKCQVIRFSFIQEPISTRDMSRYMSGHEFADQTLVMGHESWKTSNLDTLQLGLSSRERFSWFPSLIRVECLFLAFLFLKFWWIFFFEKTLNLAKNELCAISLLNTSIKYLFSCGLETKSGHTDVTIWTSVTYELLF